MVSFSAFPAQHFQLLINFIVFTVTHFSKARYSLFVLKVLLNTNQSINLREEATVFSFHSSLGRNQVNYST